MIFVTLLIKTMEEPMSLSTPTPLTMMLKSNQVTGQKVEKTYIESDC
jgi:hypothetical protein